MNHWQMIAIAYGLSFAALALEVALLLRRRHAAWRQVQACIDAVEAGPGSEAALGSQARDRRTDPEAGEAA